MNDFNDDDIKNLSIEEINELYKDIIEMPALRMAGIGYTCESSKNSDPYHVTSTT